MEEFLYRAVKRRWHEMAGSQLPEGEAVKDSEQVGCPWGGGTARPEGREPTWSYACDEFIWKPLVTGSGGVDAPTASISPALWQCGPPPTPRGEQAEVSVAATPPTPRRCTSW